MVVNMVEVVMVEVKTVEAVMEMEMVEAKEKHDLNINTSTFLYTGHESMYCCRTQDNKAPELEKFAVSKHSTLL